MIPAPLSRDDTHLVCTETLNGDHLLFLSEELGLHRGVGHDEEDQDSVCHSEKTTKKEDDLLSGSVVSDLTKRSASKDRTT